MRISIFLKKLFTYTYLFMYDFHFFYKKKFFLCEALSASKETALNKNYCYLFTNVWKTVLDASKNTIIFLGNRNTQNG